jgi:hypothetical protein
MESIPKEVGRNLSPEQAKGLAGPPCTKEDTSPCSGGETKCVNHDEYKCGTGGWSKTGAKC